MDLVLTVLRFNSGYPARESSCFNKRGWLTEMTTKVIFSLHLHVLTLATHTHTHTRTCMYTQEHACTHTEVVCVFFGDQSAKVLEYAMSMDTGAVLSPRDDMPGRWVQELAVKMLLAVQGCT